MTIPFPTAGMYTREDLKTMEDSSPVFEATDCCYITFCLQSYSLIQAQTQYHGVYVYGFLGVLLFGWLDFFNKFQIFFYWSFSQFWGGWTWEAALPECRNSLVAFWELYHGVFFPAKCVFNIKYIQNG